VTTTGEGDSSGPRRTGATGSAKHVERRLAAILSADVVEYSRRMGEDDVATVDALKRYRDVIARRVTANDGRVVDMVGDSLMAEFPDAVGAVTCALEVQQQIGDENTQLDPSERLVFRIGVSLGEVIVEGDEIYGEEVNVAARVQALAAPGGVSLSGAAFEKLDGRLELDVEDLGQYRVKNIPRPVHLYRVALPGARQSMDKGAGPSPIAGFAGRPAIAVLPFDNLSNDPEQEYFADGIAEDLITRLGCVRWCPVIARDSSFVYKGASIDLRRIAAELGVDYVLRGSVRRAGSRIRISVQFVDVATEHQVWAQRYDRELEDIFALQDEISISVIGALMPALDRVERDRVSRQMPEDLNAWHCLQRGVWHLSHLTADELSLAQDWLRKGADLDPTFSAPHSYLAVSHLYEISYQWTDAPGDALRECTAAAERAVALSDDDATAYTALGWAQAFAREYDRAIATEDRAIDLNPSYAAAYHAKSFPLAMTGRPREAISMIERAMRLSPHDPFMYLFHGHLGQAYFQLEEHEAAARCVRRSLELRPTPGMMLLLAASCALGDSLSEARDVFRRFEETFPDFSPEALHLFLPPFVVEMHLDGLRKIGWRG
jgi:adenylate cyclase